MKRILRIRKELIKEFFSRSFGTVGVALLVFFIVMSVAAPITASDALHKWPDVQAWQDNPRLVPPVWYLRLINAPTFPTITLISNNYTESVSGNLHIAYATITFKNENDGLPTGFVFYVAYEYSSRVLTGMTVYRPDGNDITFNLNNAIQFPATSGNKTTYVARITNWLDSIRKDFYDWLEGKIDLGGIDYLNLINSHMLFSKLDQNILSPDKASPLKGDYKIVVYAISTDEVHISDFKMIIQGNSFGIMGSDGFRRDVWAGLLWGAPIAFMIGLLVSLFSLIIGLIYGTVSGYYGGRLDEILMRIVDVLISIPVLPLLILFLAYFGRTASVWILIFLISIFGWMGIARVARSVTMQIKGMPFIEATRSAGAGSSWIMFRHIMPQMMPYAYANLALGVPAAVLTEAGLSFLGLGDPTLPTWGQILNHAQIYSAVQFGYWWLWIPPGLLIAGISLAFVFIGHALDEVLNPRIRRL